MFFMSNAQFIAMLIINGILVCSLVTIGVLFFSKYKRKKKNAALQFDFVARTVHDLRTPIHTINGYITLIQSQSENKEKVKDFTNRIQNVSNHMLCLVNDILDFSKLEEGKLIVENKQINLKEIFQFCLDSISNLLTENKISLQTKFEVTHNLVYSDELRLKQILLNLLSNAWKYSKEGDQITFLFQEENVDEMHSRYTFTIQDTGCGMSSEFQKHLFEPYAQEYRNQGKESTGLGLAIVKKLVNQMQGTINVESQIDQGTTFWVQFTLEYELMENNDFLRNLRILFVDDTIVSIELMKQFATQFGIQLVIANTGKEAIELFESTKENTYDFILMDLIMPKLDGFGATKVIRKMEREDAKSIPIFGMTAVNYEYQKKLCANVGMTLCLSKPLNYKQLVQLFYKYKKK